MSKINVKQTKSGAVTCPVVCCDHECKPGTKVEGPSDDSSPSPFSGQSKSRSKSASGQSSDHNKHHHHVSKPDTHGQSHGPPTTRPPSLRPPTSRPPPPRRTPSIQAIQRLNTTGSGGMASASTPGPGAQPEEIVIPPCPSKHSHAPGQGFAQAWTQRSGGHMARHSTPRLGIGRGAPSRHVHRPHSTSRYPSSAQAFQRFDQSSYMQGMTGGRGRSSGRGAQPSHIHFPSSPSGYSRHRHASGQSSAQTSGRYGGQQISARQLVSLFEDSPRSRSSSTTNRPQSPSRSPSSEEVIQRFSDQSSYMQGMSGGQGRGSGQGQPEEIVIPPCSPKHSAHKHGLGHSSAPTSARYGGQQRNVRELVSQFEGLGRGRSSSGFQRPNQLSRYGQTSRHRHGGQNVRQLVSRFEGLGRSGSSSAMHRPHSTYRSPSSAQAFQRFDQSSYMQGMSGGQGRSSGRGGQPSHIHAPAYPVKHSGHIHTPGQSQTWAKSSGGQMARNSTPLLGIGRGAPSRHVHRPLSPSSPPSSAQAFQRLDQSSYMQRMTGDGQGGSSGRGGQPSHIHAPAYPVKHSGHIRTPGQSSRQTWAKSSGGQMARNSTPLLGIGRGAPSRHVHRARSPSSPPSSAQAFQRLDQSSYMQRMTGGVQGGSSGRGGQPSHIHVPAYTVKHSGHIYTPGQSSRQTWAQKSGGRMARNSAPLLGIGRGAPSKHVHRPRSYSSPPSSAQAFQRFDQSSYMQRMTGGRSSGSFPGAQPSHIHVPLSPSGHTRHRHALGESSAQTWAQHSGGQKIGKFSPSSSIGLRSPRGQDMTSGSLGSPGYGGAQAHQGGGQRVITSIYGPHGIKTPPTSPLSRRMASSGSSSSSGQNQFGISGHRFDQLRGRGMALNGMRSPRGQDMTSGALASQRYGGSQDGLGGGRRAITSIHGPHGVRSLPTSPLSRRMASSGSSSRSGQNQYGASGGGFNEFIEKLRQRAMAWKGMRSPRDGGMTSGSLASQRYGGSQDGLGGSRRAITGIHGPHGSRSLPTSPRNQGMARFGGQEQSFGWRTSGQRDIEQMRGQGASSGGSSSLGQIEGSAGRFGELRQRLRGRGRAMATSGMRSPGRQGMTTGGHGRGQRLITSIYGSQGFQSPRKAPLNQGMVRNFAVQDQSSGWRTSGQMKGQGGSSPVSGTSGQNQFGISGGRWDQLRQKLRGRGMARSGMRSPPRGGMSSGALASQDYGESQAGRGQGQRVITSIYGDQGFQSPRKLPFNQGMVKRFAGQEQSFGSGTSGQQDVGQMRDQAISPQSAGSSAQDQFGASGGRFGQLRQKLRGRAMATSGMRSPQGERMTSSSGTSAQDQFGASGGRFGQLRQKLRGRAMATSGMRSPQGERMTSSSGTSAQDLFAGLGSGCGGAMAMRSQSFAPAWLYRQRLLDIFVRPDMTDEERSDARRQALIHFHAPFCQCRDCRAYGLCEEPE